MSTKFDKLNELFTDMDLQRLNALSETKPEDIESIN